MDSQLVNALPLHPLLCHCCHSTATQEEVHFLVPVSIVDLHLSATSPLECHSDQFFANWTESITNHANEVQICQWTLYL